MNKKKQSARITQLKAENYDLRFENEFLKNRIAIVEADKGSIISQIKPLNKEQRAELLQRIRAFKDSVTLFIEDAKKKEVELVRGEFYRLGNNTASFRFKEWQNKDICTYSCCQDDIYRGYEMNIFKGNLYVAKESNNIVVSNLVKAEEEGGKFWSDKKQDFLKLEDVYFMALNKNDFIDVYAQCDSSMMSQFANFREEYNMMIIGVYKTLYNAASNSSEAEDRTEVTKEVFIKLLKNYKG